MANSVQAKFVISGPDGNFQPPTVLRAKNPPTLSEWQHCCHQPHLETGLPPSTSGKRTPTSIDMNPTPIHVQVGVMRVIVCECLCLCLYLHGGSQKECGFYFRAVRKRLCGEAAGLIAASSALGFDSERNSEGIAVENWFSFNNVIVEK